MEKQLVNIEFRYMDAVKFDSDHKTKTITIGIFETLKEAIDAGNKALNILSKQFELRGDDKFSLNGGCFGYPKKLVTNCCYHTKCIQFFATITSLKFDDLSETIEETLRAAKRYRAYKLAEKEED